MDAKLAPGSSVVILLGVACAFASNHLCARIAFDHGASVATAVSVRATFTALLLFFLMRVQGVRIAIPRELRWPTLVAGILIATQSYSLYSAVALIPPALALLVFQTSPMLYVLLTWALGKEAPRWSALAPMLALVGLAAALNVRTGDSMAAGVAWAFLAGLSTTVQVYYQRQRAQVARRSAAHLRDDRRYRGSRRGRGERGGRAAPRDGAGWTGLVLLAVFYCIAMMSLLYVLPRCRRRAPVRSTSSRSR